MKTVGILTFQHSDNFGSELQCYALKRVIEEISGYHTEVINYSYLKLLNYFETDELKQQFKEKLDKFESFRKKYFQLSGELLYDLHVEDYPHYDYYVVGSDTVWQTPQTGDDTTYFLDFVKHDACKIAYGPSTAGNLNINNKIFEKYIPEFDHLSVREKSLRTFIRKYTDKDIPVVLDPTLLLRKEEYEEIENKDYTLPQKDYILLYLINGGNSTPYIVNFVNMVSRKYNLEVLYSLPGLPEYVFKNRAGSFAFAAPGDFLTLVRNAKLIVTNSFHGTAFSLIYKKAFYSFCNKKGGERIKNILEICGLENRLVEKYLNLGQVSFDIDWEGADKVIECEKENALEFLIKALEVR